MVKCSVVALYGLLLSLQGLLSVNAGVTSDYRRPPSRPLLPMEHELLARPIGASPHGPEQVHLSLAGPGSMAVSWLTYPQVRHLLTLQETHVTKQVTLCHYVHWYAIDGCLWSKKCL